MLRIAITQPDTVLNEEQQIARILTQGDFDLLHLRKPEWDGVRYESLLKNIPEKLHSRIVLHEHFELTKWYGVRGIHLNRRNPAVPEGFKGQVSRSCHSVQEVLAEKAKFDYVFLSPIFNSISKQGYNAAFTAEELDRYGADGVFSTNVIALGGVSPERVPQLTVWGFAGYAMLGAVWQ